MLEVMMQAEVGDDVFGEDPTVNLLQENAAKAFGMEAGLFCPSGTMTNQIAIKVHTNPGDEVICDKSSHIYNYEGGGIAFNSGCSIKPVNGVRGVFKPEDILQNINPDDPHFPRTTLVSIENTCNRGGGSFYELEEIKAISKTCKENRLKLHLDGARIFNALAEAFERSDDLGDYFDSISICLSKGLGAPVGSLLLGSNDLIAQARRTRKVMGGGMRQAGYLAAAGIYALDHNQDRIWEDHQRAKDLGEVLAGQAYVKEMMPVETNIIIFELNDTYTSETFLQKLEKEGIRGVSIGPSSVRFVTHLDINDEMLEKTIKALKRL